MAPAHRPQLVISCHADTGFASHRLRLTPTGDYFGHLDNFVGVYAVMQAFFSGRLDHDHVRIELTAGEETDLAGAYAVLESLIPEDVVVVVDVTGTVTERDLVIEKCASEAMQRFVHEALAGLSYELFAGCPDPISDADESDVYRQLTDNVFFLGIPCRGGDYNEIMVEARRSSVSAAAEAILRLAAAFASRASPAAARDAATTDPAPRSGRTAGSGGRR